MWRYQSSTPIKDPRSGVDDGQGSSAAGHAGYDLMSRILPNLRVCLQIVTPYFVDLMTDEVC
jgi:hypothetical protein